MGGKSSSSSSNASTQTTTTTTGSATGTVGDVYQGQTVNITDQFPTEAVQVFKALTDLTGNAINVAAAAGEKALASNQELAKATKQPDISLVEGFQKQTKVAIIAAAVVAVALFVGKK